MRTGLSRALLVASGFLASLPVLAAIESIDPLEMSPRHPLISRTVTDLIETWHYSRQPLDNSISSAILDQYLDTLDSNRVYFLASDVAGFGRYRYKLDEPHRSCGGRRTPGSCARPTVVLDVMAAMEARA